MINIKLPAWLKGDNLRQIKTACEAFWAELLTWLEWPFSQLDAMTCDHRILVILGKDRGLTRFTNEPLSLFRLRVKHALVNAKDAGSAAGLKRVFERLGVGYVEIHERMAGRDWDVISIVLSDDQLSGNNELLDQLISLYARTCRRYEFTSVTYLELGMAAYEINNDWQYDHASM